MKRLARAMFCLAVVVAAGIHPAVAEDDARVDTLCRLLRDSRETVAARAAKELGDMVPAARSAGASLAEILREKDGTLQRNAGWALRQVSPDLSWLVPDLRNDSRRGTIEVRARLARALGLVGAEDRLTIQRLKGLLGSPKTLVRAAAADALTMLKQGNATSLRILRKQWSSTERPVSYLAIEGLVRAAAQGVESALESTNGEVRIQAARGLAAVTPILDVPVKSPTKALRDREEHVRIAAAFALAFCKQKPLTAIPDLL